MKVTRRNMRAARLKSGIGNPAQVNNLPHI